MFGCIFRGCSGSNRELVHCKQWCKRACNMDCEALFDLLPEPRRSSTWQSQSAADSEEATVMDAEEALALLPPPKRRKTRKRWLKLIRNSGKRDDMTGAAQQQLLAAQRYNTSGQAVRYYSLIKLEAISAPLRGRSRLERSHAPI